MDDEKESLEDILNDDDIRKFFQSRDPDRKKSNPFISEETAEQYGGKASSLTKKEEVEEKVFGVSFSEHTKHLRQVARHFTWIGISVGLLIAILVALFV
jgi:hypothetical protein